MLDVFTCWPPGPLDRLDSSTISAAGMRLPPASIRSARPLSLLLLIVGSGLLRPDGPDSITTEAEAEIEIEIEIETHLDSIFDTSESVEDPR